MHSSTILSTLLPAVALAASSGTYEISDLSLIMVKTDADGNARPHYQLSVSSSDLGIPETRCEFSGGVGGCASFFDVHHFPCVTQDPAASHYLDFSFFKAPSDPYYILNINSTDGEAGEEWPISYVVPNRGAEVGQECASFAAPKDSKAAFKSLVEPTTRPGPVESTLLTTLGEPTTRASLGQPTTLATLAEPTTRASA